MLVAWSLIHSHSQSAQQIAFSDSNNSLEEFMENAPSGGSVRTDFAPKSKKEDAPPGVTNLQLRRVYLCQLRSWDFPFLSKFTQPHAVEPFCRCKLPLSNSWLFDAVKLSVSSPRTWRQIRNLTSPMRRTYHFLEFQGLLFGCDLAWSEGSIMKGGLFLSILRKGGRSI